MKSNIVKGLVRAVALTLFATSGAAFAAPASGTVTVWVGSWWNTEIPLIEKAWQTDHPEIKLAMDMLPINGYYDKFTSAALGGSPPDIIDLEGSYISTMAGQGLLETLDGKFDGLDSKDYAPGIWAASHFDGKLYGIPDRSDSEVYYFNKTVFDKAGVAYPNDDWTEDDLVKIVQKLTIPNQQWGLGIAADPSVPGNTWSTFLPMLWNHGGDILDKSNSKAIIDSKESVAGIEFWADFYTKYHATPEGTPNFNTARDLQPLFQANKLGLIAGTSNLYDAFAKTPGLKWGTVLAPGKTNMAGGWTMAVPMGATNSDAAVVFLTWFAEPQHLAAFMNRYPARISAAALPPWNNPEYDVFKKATPYSRATPQVAGWFQIATVMIDDLQQVLVGQATAQQAANSAATAIDGILAGNK